MAVLDSVETRGATLEVAIQAGLAQLGVARTDVTLEVLDEGSRGVLGIGKRDAVVRLTRLAAAARPVAAPTPVAPPATPKPAPPPVVAPTPVAKPTPPDRPTPPPDRPMPAQQPKPVAPTVAPKPKPKRPAQEPAAPTIARPMPVAKPAAPPPPAVARAEADDEDDVARPAPRDEAELQREGEVARQIVETLLAKMGIAARVAMTVEAEDDLGERTPVISVTGDNLSLLIGPRGSVLNDFQFLVRAMASQTLHGRTHFVLDVDGYREKRVATLVDLARRTADKAVQFGRAIPLNPMPAHERRIIHMTLRGDGRVTTESKGEGEARRVRIIPAAQDGREARKAPRRRSNPRR